MINLLPYNEKKRMKRLRVLRVVLVVLWSVIIVTAILCLLLLPSMTIITTRYNLAQNEITRLENAGVVVRPETIAQNSERARLLVDQFASNTTLSPNDAIAIAQKYIPTTGLTLSGYTFTVSEDQRLTMKGMVTTREVLQSYVDALQSDEHVAMVDSPITNYLKQKDNEITLVITFK
jgi:hypothetical protein